MALSVFPELMDKIDPEDVKSSLRTIESYIRYIVERVEFSVSNTFRTTTGLGSSAEALSIGLQETEDNLSDLTGQVGAMQGDVTGLQIEFSDIMAELETLTGQIGVVQGNVTGLQIALADEVRPKLQELDGRVSALENPDPEDEGGA